MRSQSESDDEDEDAEREIHFVDELQGDCSPASSGAWPPHYRAIMRERVESVEQAVEVLVRQARCEEPLILEGADIMNVRRWADIAYIQSLLREKQLLVKRSPTQHFRYFDLKKNTGGFSFEEPVTDLKRTFAEFLEESERLMAGGMPQRLYLQETLSGHEELAQEFASWRWDLLLAVSQACGWGLPDSNELFVGMQGVETPLHFDERENLFFQVRGHKEICLFPWSDYVRLYPFPVTHPCDRQSMVGNPRDPDLEAFPRFREATGYTGWIGSGDLLYIPYGWWHWLRNEDHLAASVSFWSTTKPADLSRGAPTMFTSSMITLVRRNLEVIVADEDRTKLNDAMLELKAAILEGRQADPRLEGLRQMLHAIRLPESLQDRFILEMIEGRFGIDWQRHVSGGGRQALPSRRAA